MKNAQDLHVRNIHYPPLATERHSKFKIQIEYKIRFSKDLDPLRLYLP